MVVEVVINGTCEDLWLPTNIPQVRDNIDVIQNAGDLKMDVNYLLHLTHRLHVNQEKE